MVPTVGTAALGSDAFYQDPYPTYTALRAETPVYWWPQARGWLVLRYADVLAGLRDARLGHNEEIATGARTLPSAPVSDAVVAKLMAQRQQTIRWMRLWVILRNPPDHTRLRALIQPSFTAREISALNGLAQQVIAQQLDKLTGVDEIDLIADVARPISLSLICHLLGMPTEDGLQLTRWSYALGRSLDPDASPAQQENGLFAIAALGRYFGALIDERRRRPGEGLIDQLIVAQNEGALSDEELLANVILLFFAGHSTSVGLIGNGMLALIRDPAQAQQLRAEPERMPLAVEEMLRYDSPAQLVSRTALEDLTLGGQSIARGSRVLLCLGAANRDPERFSMPDQFNVSRHPNPHLGFGHGLHLCIGAPLSRMNARLTIAAILQRWLRIELNGPALPLAGITVRELSGLPVLVSRV